MGNDEYLKQLLAKHAGNGLLIDTNLLLLLAVGNYDRRRIKSLKRTAAYTHSDFLRLNWLAGHFRQLWTTPNILTEVDNLGRQLPKNEWQGFAVSLSELALGMNEEFVRFSMAAAQGTLPRLGLTDTVTLATGQSFLLLSDDLGLYLAAQKVGYDAINFNHLRN